MPNIIEGDGFTANNPQKDQKLPAFRHSDILPNLLEKGVSQFKNDSEKYLFLYSAITAASGLMMKVSGSYKENRIFPNLFLLVVAPPASGKSVMMYAKKLIRGIQDSKRKEAQDELAAFSVKEAEARKTKSAFLLPRPPYAVPLIPGNVTGSKLITHLADNEAKDCPSILIESEIDTMAMANKKSEYGNFTDILRKGWEGEDVSMSRRGNNNEYYEAKNPKLAVAISGTPNQVKSLIGNSSDGLFSRFTVFTIDDPDDWIDVSPCEGCGNLTDFFNQQANEYKKLYEYLLQNPLEVKLTSQQWERVNQFGKKMLDEINQYDNPNAPSLAKRHAVMIFKMAMVFTAIRQYEEAAVQGERMCEDKDFETALSLVEQSLAKALKIFQQLPGGQLTKVEDRSEELYNLLPVVFTRKEALNFMDTLNVKERTIERYLRTLVKAGKLDNKERGKYKKIALTD